MKELTIKLFDTLGCTVMATSLLQAVRFRFPNCRIVVYTKFPDLLVGFEEIDNVVDSCVSELEAYDIDLRDYLLRRPHNTEPYEHLTIHIIKHAEAQLGCELKKDFPLKVYLQSEEEQAKGIVDSLRKGKKIVWLQTKTASTNKDWSKQNWEHLFKTGSSDYSFLDLSDDQYSRRLSMAITKFCDAGVTLDSFLCHASQAVRAKNVIVILGSSRPEAVTYNDQTVLYEQSKCPIQPCGFHGYSFGCKPKDEYLFSGHESTRCITDDFLCFQKITPHKVIRELDRFFNPKM